MAANGGPTPLNKEFWTTVKQQTGQSVDDDSEKDVDTRDNGDPGFDLWHRTTGGEVEKKGATYWPQENNDDDYGDDHKTTAAAAYSTAGWGHQLQQEAEFAYGSNSSYGYQEKAQLGEVSSYTWRPKMETTAATAAGLMMEGKGAGAAAAYWEEEDEAERARMVALKREALKFAAAKVGQEEEEELEKAAVVDNKKEATAAAGAFSNYWAKEE